MRFASTLSRGAALVGALTLAPASAALAADGRGEHTPLHLSSKAVQHASSGGSSILRTIIALVIVCGVIYAVARVLKAVKGRDHRASGEGLSQLATLPLGTNKSLALIRSGQDIVLVGVSESGVTPIKTYTEAEAIQNGIWTPPNQVLVGIALFLTLFVMHPTITQIQHKAYEPLIHHQITTVQAIKRGEEPLREFMFKQVKAKDLSLFVDLAHRQPPATRADVPTYVLIPAFIMSELKSAFSIGFLIFLPFLIIDLIVSSTLMSVGMMMLPPTFISLPFKILLFVLVDGWDLITHSLVQSFHM